MLRQITCITAVCFSSLLNSHAKEQKFMHQVKISPEMPAEQVIQLAANVLPTPRQMMYHQEEFIGFIHFGINTFTGKEWGNGMEDPTKFNPEGPVDTDQWCRVMKEAGMSKIMMTIKHHDGFCLWQTRYNDNFSVKASPWKNGKGDVLQQLVKSARKYGLRMGIYISPSDLYQMESAEGHYGNQSAYRDTVIPTDPSSFNSDPLKPRKIAQGLPTFKVKADDYNRYFMNQLYEALTEYGPIHEVWFDGAHPKRKGNQQYIRTEWFKMIRKLAPEAVIFGGPDLRWCGNEHGGTRPDEWNVIPVDREQVSGYDRSYADVASDHALAKTGYEVYGEKFQRNYLYYIISEVDTSIRHGWFWRNDDEQKVYSADWAFDIYERSVGGNAVFLLNVPPNKYGRFSDADVKSMVEVGRRIRNTYGPGTNLAVNAVSSAGPTLFDNDIESYWTAPDKTGEFTIKLAKKVRVNRFMIQEAISKVGQRVKSHEIDAKINGTWQTISKAGVIGYKRIHRFETIESDQFRVRITDSRAITGIATVQLHYYNASPWPVAVNRNAQGLIDIQLQTPSGQCLSATEAHKKGYKIAFTLNGTDPEQTSEVKTFTRPFALDGGGVIKAQSIQGEFRGAVTTEVIGLSPRNWQINSPANPLADCPLAHAFDGNPNTRWQTDPGTALPVPLTIQFDADKTIGGFSYLPRQDLHHPEGMVEKWRIETSVDGQSWKIVTEADFGNLLNDPSNRLFYFEKPISTSWLRFTALTGVQDTKAAGAAELAILPPK